MIVIGEKINGADFIDVCASVDVKTELATMKWLIDFVQDVVDTPIAIDSPDAGAAPALSTIRLSAMASGRKSGIWVSNRFHFRLPCAI